MSTKDKKNSAAERLRQRAEESLIQGKTIDSDSVSFETASALLHELQVHQIELEMQNEELRLAQASLELSQSRYFELYDLAPAGYLSLNTKGIILEANIMAATQLGSKRSSLINNLLSNFILKEDQDIYYLRNKALLESGEPQTYELRMTRKDGSRFWAQLEAVASINADGLSVNHIIIIDISERMKAEEILRASEERYRVMFSQSPVAIIHYSKAGAFVDANPACLDMFGLDDIKEMQNFNLFLDTSLSDEYKKQLKRGEEIHYQGFLDFDKDKNIKLYNTTKSGFIWTDINISPLKDSNEKITGYLLHGIDITERKNTENEIRYLCFHDNLTGLHNRRFFQEEIEHLDTKRQLPISIIMADSNGLKLINDIFGHYEGDSMLKETAAVLKRMCRSEDILTRWGGDEFVIFLPKTSAECNEDIVQRIKKEFKKVFIHSMPLTISMGTATKTKERQSINAIITEAENAMYKNKLLERDINKGSILFSLEQELYKKSTESRQHSESITELALKLGKSLRLHTTQLDELSLLASLHDIGKVGISEKLLLKKGRLSEKDWETLKRHSEIGFNISQSSTMTSRIAKCILSCHENWDGSGYPTKLAGETIPLLSRIVAIADAFEVMTSGRIYKKAISTEDAIKELKRCAGSQFDPVLVDKFIEILQN